MLRDQGAAVACTWSDPAGVAQASGKFYDSAAERAPSKVAPAELAAEFVERSEEWAGSGSIIGAGQEGGSSWREHRPGARRPPGGCGFRRAIAAGEVIPLRRVAGRSRSPPSGSWAAGRRL